MRMSDELRRLIWNVSSKGKLLDDKEILKVVNIVIQEKSLKEYLKEIKFLELRNNNAYYHPVNKLLIIDEQGMRNNINLRFSDVGFRPVQKVKLYHNLMIVQTLLHEIEHMEQYRKVKLKSCDYESQLLDLCYSATLYYEQHYRTEKIFDSISKDAVLSYLKFEHDYYIEDPRERLAQIRSHQQILQLIRSFYKIDSDIYQYEKNELGIEKILGYQFIGNRFEAPTITFLRRMSQEKILNNFGVHAKCRKLLKGSLKSSMMQTYSLEQRLLLGLPVRMKEYNKKTKKLVLL